jgi:hypothetical protein
MLFAGFTDLSSSERGLLFNSHKLHVGHKPPWQDGAVVALSFLKPKTNTSANAIANTITNTITNNAAPSSAKSSKG